MNSERFKEGFFHIFKAAGYSLAGLATGLRLSLAFRQETGILILLVILLAVYQKPVTTWLIALGAWLLVMMAELINTAIEETLNLITKEYNIGVKNAKDMASAAVFLMLAVNAALWLCMFILNLF
ncbi:diacylglycerol kinase [uncultured Mailhella sp.]|uniref:diacylglycerol kinase n=1 Tax=uncultured Mailhella sp. TaxID=1981031 RepID=UPI0025E20960|nr:diacylglycerol kinase [uncultured Mailhella sp.]